MLEYYESVGPLLKQRYGSLANFIRYKLDFASSPMHQLHTEQLPPVFMAQALPDITRICLNDFPYSIPREDGAHYVVWSQVPLTNASMAESDDEWQLVLDKGLSGFTGYHEWDADGLATGKDSAGREIRAFVLNKWPPALGWQTMLYVTRM